jgi:hypothetical protein
MIFLLLSRISCRISGVRRFRRSGLISSQTSIRRIPFYLFLFLPQCSAPKNAVLKFSFHFSSSSPVVEAPTGITGNKEQKDDSNPAPAGEKKRKKPEPEAEEVNFENNKRPKTDNDTSSVNDQNSTSSPVVSCDEVLAENSVVASDMTDGKVVPKNSIQNFFKRVSGSGDNKENSSDNTGTKTPKSEEVSENKSQKNFPDRNSSAAASETVVENKAESVKSIDKVKNNRKASTKMRKKEKSEVKDETNSEKSVAVVNDVTKGNKTPETNSEAVLNKKQRDTALKDKMTEKEAVSVTPTISNNLFRKKKRIRSPAKVVEVDSDASVNMESLENSPVKPCDKQCSRVVETTEVPLVNGLSTEVPVTDVKSPSVKACSQQELTPGRANAFTLLMKKKQPPANKSPNVSAW